jgi:hypothetical protein
MTASQACKPVRRACCRSIGHGTVRSNIQSSPQSASQLTAFNAVCGSFTSHFQLGQPAGPPQLQSHTSAVAFKSP